MTAAGRWLLITACVLMGLLGGAVFFKKERKPEKEELSKKPQEVLIEEVSLVQEVRVLAPAPLTAGLPSSDEGDPSAVIKPPLEADYLETDRIEEFFSTKGTKFPIVETITYKSRVPWLKGRPAWLSDYAGHFETSRHFIARSLHGKGDYLKQEVCEGDKFNVLRQDIPIRFQLVVDLSRAHMWLYYLTDKEKVLVKSYSVSVGRLDASRPSGSYTPLGKYSLGNRVAIYKPSTMGAHRGQKLPLIQVFGTRWIPFDREIANCTAPAKGLGLHGAPWVKRPDGQWEENVDGLGKYQTDGHVSLAREDMEEIFAIVTTKPTTIEIVRDFWQSELNQ